MSCRMLARGAVAYAVAGALTAVVAFLATIPCADFVTIAGMTADAAALVGWPTLLAADAVTRHRWGGRR